MCVCVCVCVCVCERERETERERERKLGGKYLLHMLYREGIKFFKDLSDFLANQLD